jgi:hypothetical protein
MKIDVLGIYAKATAPREHQRRMAQEVYDAYFFDCRVESGDPATAWFPTFQNPDTPTMTRKLMVFRQNHPPVTGWFNVEFDKTGTTVTNGYAFTGKHEVFGSLPSYGLNLSETSNDDAPTSGWKM